MYDENEVEEEMETEKRSIENIYERKEKAMERSQRYQSYKMEGSVELCF